MRTAFAIRVRFQGGRFGHLARRMWRSSLLSQCARICLRRSGWSSRVTVVGLGGVAGAWGGEGVRGSRDGEGGRVAPGLIPVQSSGQFGGGGGSSYSDWCCIRSGRVAAIWWSVQRARIDVWLRRLVSAALRMSRHCSQAPRFSRALYLQHGQLCPQKSQWFRGVQSRTSASWVTKSLRIVSRNSPLPCVSGVSTVLCPVCSTVSVLLPAPL